MRAVRAGNRIFNHMDKARLTLSIDHALIAQSLYRMVKEVMRSRNLPDDNADFPLWFLSAKNTLLKLGMEDELKSLLRVSAEFSEKEGVHGLKMTRRKTGDNEREITLSSSHYGCAKQTQLFVNILLRLKQSNEQVRINWQDSHKGSRGNYDSGGSALITKDHIVSISSSDVFSILKNNTSEACLAKPFDYDDSDDQSMTAKLYLPQDVGNAMQNYIIKAKEEGEGTYSIINSLISEDVAALIAVYNLIDIQQVLSDIMIPGVEQVIDPLIEFKCNVLPANKEGKKEILISSDPVSSGGDLTVAFELARLALWMGDSDEDVIVRSLTPFAPDNDRSTWAVSKINRSAIEYFGEEAISSLLKNRLKALTPQSMHTPGL